MADVDLSKLKLRYMAAEDEEDEEGEEGEPASKKARVDERGEAIDTAGEDEVEVEDEDDGSWPKVREFEICQEDRVLGRLEFLYINADAPGLNFFLVMDGFSNEASEMAFELFDRWGQLQRRYLRQGTRIWGRKTTLSGKIFYLKEIRVKPQYRKRGVGAGALNALMHSTGDRLLKDIDFLFCWPATLTEDSVDFMLAKACGLFEDLAAAGFRRVRTTRYFCCARNPEHASHRIKGEDDAEMIELDDEKEPVNDQGLTRYQSFRRSAGMPL
ncbi:hypothetical protein JCM11251_002185 [Rhodosporidiobolus azoricus]